MCAIVTDLWPQALDASWDDRSADLWCRRVHAEFKGWSSDDLMQALQVSVCGFALALASQDRANEAPIPAAEFLHYYGLAFAKLAL